MEKKKVALLTAGGFAPCLSTAIGNLIEKYTQLDSQIEIIAYKYGYLGLLTGQILEITPSVRAKAHLLKSFGGSPIGNSRVKLTNKDDLVKRGIISQEQDPFEVATAQLLNDKIDILHTIGGDDTNTTAADLAEYLAKNHKTLTVVGLPKTIDNDIIPIKQSLGAATAAEQVSLFSQNIFSEHNSGPRMLIINEIMGRHCGWLAAQGAREYRQWLKAQEWNNEIGLSQETWDINALYVPEMPIDIESESARLRRIMDKQGSVNIFLSEGAGINDIISEIEKAGQEVETDAFGHVRLEKINPGAWFAKQFAHRLGAQKVMVQKCGYFSRSARSNEYDLNLIKTMTDMAVEEALKGNPGVIGHDEENNDVLSVIDFKRIEGAKKFNISQDWFQDILTEIGQNN